MVAQIWLTFDHLFTVVYNFLCKTVVNLVLMEHNKAYGNADEDSAEDRKDSLSLEQASEKNGK